MRAHPTNSVILLSSAFCASTTAQSVNQVPKPSDQPVGEVPTSAATVISAATATLVKSNLAPDEIISIRRLPHVAELKAAAGAQGLVVGKIVLTDAQITAVYRNTSNQSHTVCYQFLQAIDSPTAIHDTSDRSSRSCTGTCTYTRTCFPSDGFFGGYPGGRLSHFRRACLLSWLLPITMVAGAFAP